MKRIKGLPFFFTVLNTTYLRCRAGVLPNARNVQLLLTKITCSDTPDVSTEILNIELKGGV